jgi:hypothetical protein
MDRKSRLLRIRFSILSPGLPNSRRKSPKVSGRLREYSRFGETIGGDRFDQDCRPTPNPARLLLKKPKP